MKAYLIISILFTIISVQIFFSNASKRPHWRLKIPKTNPASNSNAGSGDKSQGIFEYYTENDNQLPQYYENKYAVLCIKTSDSEVASIANTVTRNGHAVSI